MQTENGLKIAVYGAGAMGTVLGALLTKTGADVTLISRNEEHVNGLKTAGAKILFKAVNKEMTVPVYAITPNEMTERYDVVFLMTKQKENAEIVKFLLPYVKDDGVICTTQNGLPEPSILKVAGEKKTYGAVLSWGATFVGGGTVELTSEPSSMTMEIGGYQNGNEWTERLVELLKPIGKIVGSENFVKGAENLAGIRWSKLSLNSAFSGLSVVTGLTFGEIAKRMKTRKIALDVLQETFTVANACGVKLAPMQGRDLQKLLGGRGFFNRIKGLLLLPIAMKNHKRLVSGMLKDVQKGRKCEIDFIDGAVADIGKEAGVKTPRTAKIVEIVHGIENGLYEISYENIDFFNE